MIHTKVTPNDVLVNFSFINKDNMFDLSTEDILDLSNRVENYLQKPGDVTPWEKVKELVRKQL